jgi:L-2,4-diaminobutyrate transaminase
MTKDRQAERSVTQIDRAAVMHPFSALSTSRQKDVVVLKEARGVWVTDSEGHQFLDAGSGLWCVNVGYGRAELAEVAARAMTQLSFSHTFSQFSNENMVRLSERLLQLAPANMQRVLFANSGSESNDTQIKLVRRYNNIRGKPQKKKIISRRSAYHGSTLGAASLTGLDLVHRTFDLPIPGVLHTLAADYHRRPDHVHDERQYSRYLADELDRLIEAEGPETVAAFIAEPITGSGGVLVPPAGYFRAIHEVLRKHDVLMIADEVITGFGRTGAWFASPGLDLEPDLITIAKGLSSGYFPVSASLVSARVSDILYAEQDADGMFGHGFTSSGHPVGAAVALANLDILEREQLPQNSQVVGDYLISQIRQRIGAHELVGDIRGRGLLIAIEFDSDRAARRPFDNPTRVGAVLADALFQERLFVRGGHGRVLAALAPPLVLSKSEADEIVNRLERAVDRFAAAVAAQRLDI